MREYKDLRLIPDWPRIRQLVANHLGKTGHDVQLMRDAGNSLDQVELEMAIEEVLDRLHR